MIYDAAIIGAGPAGLLCARQSARRGLRTALIDSHAEPGVKLAVSGGGRGNVTNRILAQNRYLGEDTALLRSVLRSFTCEDALALMRELRLPVEERDFGQIFGLRPASLLAERLAVQCDDAGVDFYLGETVGRILRPAASEHSFGGTEDEFFVLFTSRERIRARTLVLACGSPACPQLGGSDRLARLAVSWGHTLVPFRPVLVPLIMPDGWPLAGLEGISLNVRLGLERGGSVSWPDPEGIRPLLFTHRGVSGPAVLTVSCWWRSGDGLVIDFLPELSVSTLLDARENSRLLARNLLSRHLPARLAKALCPPDLAERKTAGMSRKDRQRLADACHRFRAAPTGTEGMKRAEAAAGGIALASLSRRLESLSVPGLFFCGEIVDITGLLGGYNIHWAFASGQLVGNALAETLKKPRPHHGRQG